MNFLTDRLGLETPIIQAPMAGVSTPALAAAISNAGGLGSIGIGATDASGGKAMIDQLFAATNKPFNVNVFCHRPAKADSKTEAAWLDYLKREFEKFGAVPPVGLSEIYSTFVTDEAMFRMMLETRPRVVSFHFGLPPADRIAALKQAGVMLLASATSLSEARALVDAGIDAIVAQGYEAGGHRGVFDPDGPDERLSTFTLVRLLAHHLDTPIIAAGGIMDGAGIAAMMTLGACGAQLGTAFVACPESSADAAYRAALLDSPRTEMTAAISGRSARGIANRFMELGAARGGVNIPDYPIAYDAGKALNAAAKAKGESSYAAQWAGQGASLARSMPAAELLATLRAELDAAQA